MLFWRKWAVFGCVGMALVGACGQEEEELPVEIERLDASEHLMRASMAIRGVRPSIDDFESVAMQPNLLEQRVDAWLDSPEFGETIKDMHAELYLLRDDIQFQLPVRGTLVGQGYNQADLHHSTVEAPLELVREVVLDDRPYTEILTSPTTLADDVVAAVYGLSYDPDGPRWQHTTWSDGRPQSGLLSDSQMWRRHVSNAQNFHRGRANFVSRAFLCEDIGARDVFVEGGVNLADPDEVAEAVNGQPGCIGCHNALDPLAAFFWGYKEQFLRGAINTAHDGGCEWNWDNGPPPRGNYRVEHWCYPLKFYDVVDERNWELLNLPPPSYFGAPARDVTDLGRMITEDPRFASCTARTFAGYLTQTDRAALPSEWVAELQTIFIDSGFRAKELVRAIVLSEPFAAARVIQGQAFVAGLQTVRPEQLERTVTDLTGFAWRANEDSPNCGLGGNNCWGDVDVLSSDVYGLRSMMGGVDGKTVTFPTHTPTPTRILGVRRLADDAAGFVVDHDLFVAEAGDPYLLDRVDADDTDESAIRDQLSVLFLRLFGQAADLASEDIDDAYALWAAAHQRTNDTGEAWRVVVSALLRDPQMVLY